jgi:hypothetical protein
VAVLADVVVASSSHLRSDTLMVAVTVVGADIVVGCKQMQTTVVVTMQPKCRDSRAVASEMTAAMETRSLYYC